MSEHKTIYSSQYHGFMFGGYITDNTQLSVRSISIESELHVSDSDDQSLTTVPTVVQWNGSYTWTNYNTSKHKTRDPTLGSGLTTRLPSRGLSHGT